jgi:predicted nuclease of predicted toxin-antitoxin system
VKFLLDESTDQRLAAYLSARGHDVKAIARDYPNALDDRRVLALARRERRVLITNDLDFGELIVRERLPHSGLILLRLHDTSLALKQSRLDVVLTRHADQLREFLVVTEGRVRRRLTG